MMSLDQLAALPEEIREHSEKPFNAIGSIDLQWETSILPDGSLSCKSSNIAIVDGSSFQIAGSEFSDARQPLVNVPMNGYLVGDLLVLEKTGVKQLSDAELSVSDNFFPDAQQAELDPVTGGAADPSIAASIGGKTYHFESQAVVEQVAQILADSEAVASASNERELAHGLQWLRAEADGGDGDSYTFVPSTPFQNDNLNVLFIRADFPDLTGEAVTQAVLETSLAEVNTRVQQFSYGKASVSFTVTPSIYRLTTAANVVALAGDSATIIAEARAAAAADKDVNDVPLYTLADYDVVAVYFPDLAGISGSKIKYGGLATVGGGNHWINGVQQSSQVHVILHEFGHNYGLYHANYLNPARSFTGPNDEYLDPNMVSFEYGDIYDRMGSGDKDKGYFSPYATSRLDWMPGSKVIEPTAAGTFRIHRFDHPDAKNNPALALRIPMGGSRYNWVGLRQLFTETAGKAYVVGEGIYINRPNLIDTSPGSLSAGAPDRSDSTLPVGSNFYDSAAGVRITNMATGGTAPNEYIDVKVEFDPRLGLESTNIQLDESSGNAALVVNRSFNSSGACSVSYSTAAGTATEGTDYYSASGTITWADGDSNPKTIYVPIRPDSISEGSETFTLTLSSPTNAVVPPSISVATITILDAGSKITEFDAPFFNFTVEAIAPLDNGKVLVGGSISEGVTGNIARFNPNGSEDTAFQKGTGFNNTVKALLLQTDGKVIVGGDFTSYNGTACSRITRLNADGTIDTDFNTALGTGASSSINAIALEQSGSILVGGGFTDFNGTTAQGLIRISSTGSTLNTLNTTFSSGSNTVKAILPQADGKIMVGGSFSYDFASGFGFRFGIARLNQNGSRDTSFEPGYGTHFADEPTPVDPPEGFSPQDGRFVNAGCESIVRQADGNYIIGGGFTRYNESVAKRIVSLLPNGSINTNFSPPSIENGLDDGVFTLQGTVVEVAILPTGTVVVGGFFTSPAGKVIALQNNGTTSADFSFAGGTTGSSVRSFATDSTGNLYIGGNFFDFAGSSSRPIVKVSGGLDSFTIWKTSQFTAAQITSGNTDPEDDFDNDGILNITEMALGTSPTIADSPHTFAIAAENLSIQSGSSSDYLCATMERSANNVGVWLVAQFSSDLSTWLPVNPVPGSNAIYDVSESSSTRFTVKDKTAVAPGSKRFVRFKAVLPN